VDRGSLDSVLKQKMRKRREANVDNTAEKKKNKYTESDTEDHLDRRRLERKTERGGARRGTARR